MHQLGSTRRKGLLCVAIEKLRFDFVPSGLPQAFFAPGRHDAAQMGWNMRFDSGCSCVQYVGNSFQIPSL